MVWRGCMVVDSPPDTLALHCLSKVRNPVVGEQALRASMLSNDLFLEELINGGPHLEETSWTLAHLVNNLTATRKYSLVLRAK